MATQAPLSTYVTTPEGEERVRVYKDAQENLRQALDSRQNQLFNPTLLALSQALGSPTKTGSFGEVLGNVAGAVGTSQEAEQKRAREIAQMKFEVAKNELQSYQTTENDKEFRNLINTMTGRPAVGAAPTVASPTAPTAGAPAGASTNAPSGAAPASADQVPGRITASPAQVLQLSDPRFGGRGDSVVKALNYQRDQIISTPQGPFNRDTGKFLDEPLPNEEQKPVTTPYGEFKLFPSQTRRFYEAEQRGEGREYLKSILTPRSKPSSDDLPPDATARDLEKKRKELTAEGDVRADNERKASMINRSVQASTRIPSLSSLEQFAQSPDSSKLLGVFEGSSLGQAIAKMAEPTAPQIRDAFTNYGLPEGIKSDQGFALQQIALVNADMRKILRAPGEGAQSDMENRAALAAGLDKSDTPGALLKKVRFLKAQAEFERDLGRELNKSKLTPTDFLLSDNYDRLLQGYEQKLNRVLGLAPQQSKPQTQGPARNYGPANEKLNKTLGINQ